MLLFLAEIIPAVTVPPKPKGLPIAITQSPILALSEFPNFTGINLSSEIICKTAISDNGSEPTILALENFYPRMPKGSIIAFDELDNSLWPGETKAMLEFFHDNKLKIARSEFDPYIGFAEVGS